jgi:hypothetical protein
MTMAKTKTTNPAEILFREPGDNAPAALLAEVEIPIREGALAGMKVTGITVWRKKDDPGHVFVSFPARAYEVAGETRFWEHVRAGNGDAKTVASVRERILDAYKAHKEGAAA